MSTHVRGVSIRAIPSLAVALLVASLPCATIAQTAESLAARPQSGPITLASVPRLVVPFAGSYAVTFDTTPVGGSNTQTCYFNCFAINSGTCNASGTVALTKAASPPFRSANLRKGNTTAGGCGGTPVSLPVTLQPGEYLLTDFVFSPTATGTFQDSVVYTVTPSGAPSDTYTWQLTGSTPGPTAATVQRYPTPTAQAGPAAITLGPDGNLWFAEAAANKIGRITPAGVITEFPIPTANAAPAGIATGIDGNLWFTEMLGNRIGRMTPAGAVTEFPLHTSGSLPGWIILGGDGATWFAEAQYNNVGWISPAGSVAEYHLNAGTGQAGGIFAIAAANDQSIWFTENHANRIGRVSATGQFTEFNLPTANVQPGGIVPGPDGNFWFTESQANGNARIGRITPAGVVTEFPITTAQSKAESIVVGPDGALWFSWSTANNAGRIGRITTSGTITEFDLPAGISADVLAFGADGALWFTDFDGSAIGRTVVAAPLRRRAVRH
jgi:virginiamycin B lyase